MSRSVDKVYLRIGILLMLMLVFCPERASANHILAADIDYTCLGGTSYEVTLNLYRDCSGAALLPQDIEFVSDCGTSFTIQNINPSPLTGTEVSQLCADSLVNSTCNGGTLPGTELYEFSTIVNLANCDDWTISWRSCCRTPTINAIGTFGTYVEAVLSSATAPCNNSPVFNDAFIPYVCVGQPISYNFGIIEPDGDSLSYSLIDGRFAAPIPTPIAYQGGYSGAAPFPVLTLDPLTGQLNFQAPMIGNYVVVVLVEEFDAAGNLIGSVMRDLMVVVLPCTGSVPNSASITNNTAGNLTGNNSIQLCDGEAFCVDVTFSDPDPGDVLSVSASAATMPPGATLTVTGTNPAIATFCWTTDITQSPVNVLLTASDGSCPIENLALAGIAINIFNNGVSPDPGIDNSILICEDGGNVDLFQQLGGTPDTGGSWTYPNGQPHSGVLDPSTDPDGQYTYTVPGVCGAADASSVVSVSINLLPDPGIGSSPTICNSVASFNLFTALLGSPAAGGTWTDPNGNPHSGSLDPTVDPSGAYSYTVNGVFPCSDSTVTVNVTLSSIPDAGADSIVSFCDNGPTIDLFDQLGGTPAVGGTWTGPGGNPVSAAFTPGLQVPGNYTYSIAGVAPCGGASTVVTVNVTSAGDPGVDSVLTFCGSPNLINLLGALGGTPDAGGIWTDPLGSVHSGVFNPVLDPLGVYTYTLVGMAPCSDTSATVAIGVVAAPNPGISGTAVVCAVGIPFALIDSLGGTPNAGGVWTDPSGNPFSGTYDPATGVSGVFTYTVSGSAPCVDASASVTVSFGTSGNAGTSGSQTFCASLIAVDLFTLLGAADPGGTWTDPNGNPFAQPYISAVDPAGVYTYSVAGAGACPGGSATITTTNIAAPDAGLDNSIVICSDGASITMLDSLLGTPDPGGVWSGPNALATPGVFDPSIDTPGLYTYTVGGTLPCLDASTFLNIVVTPQLDPGTSALAAFCSADGPTDLFSFLGGTPDVGGTWSDPNGNPFTQPFDPNTDPAGSYIYTLPGNGNCGNVTSVVSTSLNPSADAGGDSTIALCSNSSVVDLFTLLQGTPGAGGSWTDPNGNPFVQPFNPSSDAAGAYVYTVAIAGPCPSASATVTVNVSALPNSGTGTFWDLCETYANSNLINLLGGTPNPGGSWTDPNGNPVPTGVLAPATAPSGLYTYTVLGTAPCPDAQSQVNIVINSSANAGNDTLLAFCDNAISASLFNLIGGTPDPGGVWTGPGGAVFAGQFNPNSDPPGVYQYTLQGAGSCPPDSAQLTVSIIIAPDAGLNGSIDLCSNAPSVSLFASLQGTPDAGGTWTDPSGNPFSGTLDPAVDAPGAYTYSVAGTVPCASVSAVVQVNIFNPVDAGGDNTIDLCSNGIIVDLFTQLVGTPTVGGNWSGPVGMFSGQFDPSVDPPGIYTYTVTGTAPCSNSSANVTINVNVEPNAGADASVSYCDQSPAIPMLNSLNGSPAFGGSWTDPNGSPHSGIFDSSVDIAGVYTYTVLGTAPCVDASASLTVSLTSSPTAGVSSSIDVCSNAASFVLVDSLGGLPDPGGIWTDSNSNPFSGTFDPSVDPSGVYTYSVSATAPCVGATADITVSVVNASDAGVDASISVCPTGGAVTLFNQLGGTPSIGGTWTGPNGIFSGTLDPTTDPAGNYVYTILGAGPCSNVSATVTVSYVATPNAGTAGLLNTCSDDSPTSLFAQLGGTPDNGGTWTDPNGVVHSGQFDPAVDPAGVYTYSIAGAAPCPGASQTVNVSVIQAPDAGANGSVTVCAIGGSVGLFAELGGSPDAGGSWVGPNGLHSGQFDPAVDPAGTYTYTVIGLAPCADQSSDVVVSITAVPNAGTAGSVDVCSSSAALNLFAQLGGTPDNGGTWTDPNGASHSGQFDPTVDPGGVYTYTLNATPPCPSAAQTVTVNLIIAPDAGLDNTANICAVGGAASLFSLLSGTPDLGGIWTGPNGASSGTFDPAVDPAGVYTYTVAGVMPCSSASASVTVVITNIPDAGTPGSVDLCSSGSVVDLFNSLGGAPDLGGAWTDPNGNAHSGQLDPSLDPAGNYTYTIAAVAPCPGASQIVSVNIFAPVDAGQDANITYCDNVSTSNLFNVLGGTPNVGGSWLGPNGPNSGNFDPAVDTPGQYTYTVLGTSPCPNASATVTVGVQAAPNPGFPGSISVCTTGSPIALFPQLGGADIGGSWTDPNGIANGGIFDPVVDAPGAYTYTLVGTAPCVNATQVITVNLVSPPDAGGDSSVTVCTGDPAFGLFTLLSGSPNSGGVWLDPSLNPHSGTMDPAVDPIGNYTYVASGASCPNDSAIISVNVIAGPNAGTGNALSLCSSDQAFNMADSLIGNPSNAGVWTDLNGNPVNSNFDPALSLSGTYLYTVQGNASCPDDTASLTLNVILAPSAGNDSTLTVCANDPVVNLTNLLGGSPSVNGNWTTPGGLPYSGLLDPGIDSAGVYSYTVSGTAPCANAVSDLTVSIVPIANAGVDTAALSCSVDPPFSLLSSLGGTPVSSGVWTDLNGDPVNPTFDPSSDSAGVFLYTVVQANGCGTDSALLNVQVVQASHAGTNTSVTLCANDQPFTLFDSLGGNPDTLGLWFMTAGGLAPSVFDPASMSSGQFLYVAQGIPPCLADTAVMQVTILTTPDPQIQFQTSGGCAPTIVQFLNLDSLNGNCLWDFGNGDTSTNCNAATNVYVDAGTYTPSLTVALNNGCTATAFTLQGIDVFDQPIAGINPSPAIVSQSDPVVFLQNTASGFDSVFWDLGVMGSSTQFSPTVTYPSELPEVYEVCQYVFNSPTCFDSTCALIEVSAGLNIFVPNAFTPDGNGVNDLFVPAISGLRPDSYEFRVFNRWGDLIFSTTQPGAAWDGRFKGTLAQQDVYVWRVTAQDSFTGNKIDEIGHVTLVR